MINLIFMAFMLRSSLAASDAASPAPPVHFTNFDRSAKGWATWSPRAEIAPKFGVNATGGRAGGGALSIACAKTAEFGAWRTVVSGVAPGKVYRFTAFFKSHGVGFVQRSVSARL